MADPAGRLDIFRVTSRYLLRPVAHFLDDDDVSEILINGLDPVYVERRGRLRKTDVTFPDEQSLMAAVRNIVQYVGKRITEHEPRVDARLPDGSRIHVVIPPASRNGVVVSIRKFQKHVLSARKLLEFGSLGKEMLEFLGVCIVAGKNLLISGGTGTGKTSLLNVLASMIPPAQRVLVIEDSSELQLKDLPHVLYMEARPADEYGRGEVTIRDLFHSSLRLRPDRIVIGEVRGGEALDLLQALTSGHGGSLCTMHANHPLEALDRLETMAMQSGLDIPIQILRSYIGNSIHVIVQVERMLDGARRVTEIAEVLPLAAGEYETQTLFEYRGGVGEGAFRAVREPSFLGEIAELGFWEEEDLGDLFR